MSMESLTLIYSRGPNLYMNFGSDEPFRSYSPLKVSCPFSPFCIASLGFDPVTLGLAAQVFDHLTSEASWSLVFYPQFHSPLPWGFASWLSQSEAPFVWFNIRSPTLELLFSCCLFPLASFLLPRQLNCSLLFSPSALGGWIRIWSWILIGPESLPVRSIPLILVLMP